MNIAIYPGSFNPFHAGHADVLNKALQVFDRVIVAQGINPLKKEETKQLSPTSFEKYGYRVRLVKFEGLLIDYINKYNRLEVFGCSLFIGAVVRGLRHTGDFVHEQMQQYNYEDLGLKLPVVFFTSDRKLVHISSTTIRALDKFK